jgi:uncharacterized membrane protein YjgN (DUF898 family)
MQIETAAPSSQKVHNFQFHGTGGDLFLLILKNLFLTVITLGIYAAWARAERRKFLWSNLEISGQRLVFTGTGMEIFKGYLKVLGFYAVFLGGPMAAEKVMPGTQVPVQIALFVVLMILLPFAIYWSRAYLLSRTQWRGIRFGLVPGAGQYATAFLIGYVLTIVTLGLYAPVWINKMHRILVSNMRYGSEPFVYTGTDGEAFRIGLKGLILSILTLGIYSFWWQADMQRFTLENTALMGAKGRSTMTGGDFLVFALVGGLATTFSLGLAFPWVLVWIVSTTMSRITFHGDVDFKLIAQRAHTGDAAGDALAGELGVDLAI